MRKLLGRQVRRTTLTFLFCLMLLLGMAAAHRGTGAGQWWIFFVILALFSLRTRSIWTLLFVGTLGFTLGLSRGNLYMQKLAAYNRHYDHKVTITAIAKQDATYNNSKQLAFDASDIVVQGSGEHLRGKINLSGFGENAVFAGDMVRATGKLKASRGSYQGRMSFAQLTVVERGGSLIDNLRRKFTAGMQSALPEPAASFAMGILVGQRNNLPPELSQSLMMIGLTHIIAVSGYNLTILLRSAERVGAKRSKRFTVGFAFLLITVFLLFTGNSASIVRAAIVSTLSIIAGYYGRQFKPLVLLVLAAAITAYASPFYLWSDVSWYLSFLAFYGVMVVAPLLSRHWPTKLKENVAVAVALESVSAEIMTLPYMLHIFGQMSFIGLVANVLVTALVPLAMLLGLIAGLAGMLIPLISGWFAWPAKILLTYMLDISQLLSHVPHIFIQNLRFSLAQMVVCYVVISMVSAALWWKQRPKHAKITDEISETSEEVRFERSFEVVNNQA